MGKNETGKLGEKAAAKMLEKNGCIIVCSNYRARFGEIDIIAQDEKYIIFAEVKTRSKGSLLQPREAVDFKKQLKIIKTAEIYLSQNGMKLQPRFDVIEVITEKTGDFKVSEIHHIKNAFTL